MDVSAEFLKAWTQLGGDKRGLFPITVRNKPGLCSSIFLTNEAELLGKRRHGRGQPGAESVVTIAINLDVEPATVRAAIVRRDGPNRDCGIDSGFLHIRWAAA